MKPHSTTPKSIAGNLSRWKRKAVEAAQNAVRAKTWRKNMKWNRAFWRLDAKADKILSPR